MMKIRNSILLLSNPCIEYWFLLHYTDLNREISTAECLSLLKSKDPDYSKGIFSNAMKRKLIENIGDASARAIRKEAFANPSSSVHLLTAEIARKG